jgi:hypothetical protein
MTDETANLILEHLRHIREDMPELRLDVSDLKLRMTAVEGSFAHAMTHLAGQSMRLDRIDERMARIERRLELADA